MDRGAYPAYDDVVLVKTVDGEVYRVREPGSPHAKGFAERIAREGVWITGGPILFIPAHRIAHVELQSPKREQ